MKRKITASMLLVSLAIMSVFVSTFATSTTLTYARSQAAVNVIVARGAQSSVSSVDLEQFNSGGAFTRDYGCVNIAQGQQHSFGTWADTDKFKIAEYLSGGCTGSGAGSSRPMKVPSNGVIWV